MANNKTIQILRTDEITNVNKDVDLLEGQPFYNKQKNYLTIGNGTKKANGLPITVPTVEGWFADAGGSGLNAITGTKPAENANSYKISPIIQDSTNKLAIENKYDATHISKIILSAKSDNSNIDLSASDLNLGGSANIVGTSPIIELQTVSTDPSAYIKLEKDVSDAEGNQGKIEVVSNNILNLQGQQVTTIKASNDESIILNNNSNKIDIKATNINLEGNVKIEGKTTIKAPLDIMVPATATDGQAPSRDKIDYWSRITANTTTMYIDANGAYRDGETDVNNLNLLHDLEILSRANSIKLNSSGVSLRGYTINLKTSESNPVAQISLINDASNDRIQIKAPKIHLNSNNTDVIGINTDTNYNVKVTGNVDITSNVNIQNTTPASSGGAALVVAGGIKGGSLYTGATTITGVTSITDTTGSTGTSYGALKVSGGVGVAENLYVGGNIVASGTNSYIAASGTNSYIKASKFTSDTDSPFYMKIEKSNELNFSINPNASNNKIFFNYRKLNDADTKTVSVIRFCDGSVSTSGASTSNLGSIECAQVTCNDKVTLQYDTSSNALKFVFI